MTNSRLSHQCCKNGCDSEACWQLYIRFVTTTPQRNLIPMTAKHWVKVCDRHRKAACEAFLTERSLNQFAAGLGRENLGMPHPGNIQFEFADLREHRVQ